ncbi:MAG: SIR2 family NAD-dependent protein deacylase [Chitinophagaceae bacterium]
MEEKNPQKGKPKLVVLSGAGISAESGLKTFRDSDGLWEGYNVYEVATPQGFEKNPQLVLNFYNMRRIDVANTKPNAAHIAIAELEKDFDITVVTQNIDDLHERGGSTNVVHLHGEIFKMRSVYNVEKTFEIKGDINVGDLADDGGQLRPFIVWFNEPVPMLDKAVEIVRAAEVFVIIGTSLQVYPAASLINYVSNDCKNFIIDKSIPETFAINNITAIEKSATEGVIVLNKLLNKL